MTIKLTGAKLATAQKASDDAYAPKHLQLWTMPAHYFGPVWPGYYVASCGQFRDSDALQRSNFTASFVTIKNATNQVPGEETVILVRENCSMAGWQEWIAISQDDNAALKAADAIAEHLGEYPVLDDDLFSDYEFSECDAYWKDLTPRERVALAMIARDHDGTPVWMTGRMALGDLYNHDCADEIYTGVRMALGMA